MSPNEDAPSSPSNAICKSLSDTWRVRRKHIQRVGVVALALLLLWIVDPQLEDAFGWLTIALAFVLLSGWYTGFYVHVYSALHSQIGRQLGPETLAVLKFVPSEAQFSAPPVLAGVGCGTVYVVQIWSTWTGQEHIDDMNKLWLKFSKRGVAFVCVTKEEQGKVATFLADSPDGRKIRYPVAVDDDQRRVNKAFPTLTIPHTFVVGADGVIVWHGLCIDMECGRMIEQALNKAESSARDAADSSTVVEVAATTGQSDGQEGDQSRAPTAESPDSHGEEEPLLTNAALNNTSPISQGAEPAADDSPAQESKSPSLTGSNNDNT